MKHPLRLALLAALAAPPALAQQPAPAAPAVAAERQREGDARTERALRRVLGVLIQQYGELTGTVPDSLNDGDAALREALRALEAGRDAAAAASIRKAIAALQQGGRSMSQQLARQFGQRSDQNDDQNDDEDDDGEDAGQGGQGGSAQAAGTGQQGEGTRGRRDPLGRRQRDDGTGQAADETGVRLPDEMEQARAHAIQEELRRREAERTRPQPELDYIGRLLRQF